MLDPMIVAKAMLDGKEGKPLMSDEECPYIYYGFYKPA